MKDPVKVTQSLAADFNKFIDNLKKVVKITELRNSECVAGAANAIPFKAVEVVSSRFVNTIYGYFIGNRLAFPLVENYVKNTWAKYGLKRIQLHEEFFLFQFETKEGMESVLENGPWLIRRMPLILNIWSPNTDFLKAEVKKAPVWVKLHHVLIVAYSEIGLSLITTQLGKPVMLDSYTSNMCLSSWGRSTYARALIEVSADVELKDELVIAIPVGKDNGHTLATITIEYEWKPPRCSTCLIFDHTFDKCPKLPKEVNQENVVNDGFEAVIKKKNRMKNKTPKQVYGVKLSKPSLNLHYRRVEKGENSKNEVPKSNANVTNINSGSASQMPTDKGTNLNPYNLESVTLKNSFTALTNNEDTDLWSNLGMHKLYIRQRPWCLLGDFNAALFLDDMLMGSSNIDISMRDFKECVDDIEVMDDQKTGLKFTWTQKPKGADGVLKKIDRVMANLEFFDMFLGVHAIFQPYRISDHSPTVLCFPRAVKAKPKPFKFTNILVRNNRFKEVVTEGWYITVSVRYIVVTGLRNAIRVPSPSENALTVVADAFVTHYQVYLGQPDISDQEIKEAIFSMGNDKSPGPDGFTAAFFKEAWDIVATDVMQVVRKFFVNVGITFVLPALTITLSLPVGTTYLPAGTFTLPIDLSLKTPEDGTAIILKPTPKATFICVESATRKSASNRGLQQDHHSYTNRFDEPLPSSHSLLG
ncbi:zinc knuckle CX2CX4HX4C containing protein [Tanacetum coccineum]